MHPLLPLSGALLICPSLLALDHSDDAALEEQLQVLKSEANDQNARSARQVYLRYAAQGHPEPARHWAKVYTDILEQEAKDGNSKSMMRLGASYLRGLDMLTPNLEKAITYFQSAADLGEPSAAYILGELSAQQNDSEAAQRAFARARELYTGQLDNADIALQAQYWLGLMHLRGEGGARDIPMAVSLLEQAAEGKHQWALQELFRLYTRGELIERDDKRAFGYALKLADEAHDAAFQYTVAAAYLKGQGVAQDKDRGMQYLHLSAKANHPGALCYLANSLEEEGKLEEAAPLYRQAASMGEPYAITTLGEWLLEGKGGLAKNEQEAIQFLSIAANRFGSPVASYLLAQHYLSVGNTKEANAWIIAASDQGVLEAYAQRGWLHMNPFAGEEWNPARAYQWWSQGKNAGDETCSFYWNLFLYAFIPALLFLCFLGPLLVLRYLARSKAKKEAMSPRA